MRPEYWRQLLHISAGIIVVLFPYVSPVAIIILMVLGFTAMAIVGQRLGSIVYGPDGLAGPFYLTLTFIGLLVFSMFLGMPLYVVAAAIGIATLGDGTASLLKTGGGDDVAKSLTLLGLGSLGGFLAAVWTVGLGDPHYQALVFIAVIGGVTGSLLERISWEVDDNITMPLGSAMTMWLFDTFQYTAPAQDILFALTVGLVLGYLAYRVGVADLSGLLSGALLGLLVIVFADIRWFLALLVFFVLGGVFTKYKYADKRSRGIAQEAGGARGYRNVFGNGLAPLVLAICYGLTGDHPLYLVAFLGAVATAAGDTLASEIGQTYQGMPVMITTLERVPPGTDGAVSLLGIIACLGGSMAISGWAYASGMLANLALLGVVILGGFLGTNLDSLLGATLQREGVLSNSGVNLVATTGGGVIAAALYLIL